MQIRKDKWGNVKGESSLNMRICCQEEAKLFRREEKCFKKIYQGDTFVRGETVVDERKCGFFNDQV